MTLVTVMWRGADGGLAAARRPAPGRIQPGAGGGHRAPDWR